MFPLAVSDLAVALISAGSAIGGAVCGGAMTGYITLRAEDKRQAFAREIEARRAEDERRRERHAEQAAGRLLLEELLTCGSALKTSANVGGGPAADVVLSVAVWRQEAKYLAEVLPFDLWWEVLVGAYAEIDRVMKQYRSTDEWPPPDQLREACETVSEASDVLAAYLGQQAGLAGEKPSTRVTEIKARLAEQKDTAQRTSSAASET